jgi:hypothetical protein
MRRVGPEGGDAVKRESGRYGRLSTSDVPPHRGDPRVVAHGREAAKTDPRKRLKSALACALFKR